MRHPQTDLLIVYALVRLAREHRDTEWEDDALVLASEIAGQHGLTVAEAIRQLE